MHALFLDSTNFSFLNLLPCCSKSVSGIIQLSSGSAGYTVDTIQINHDAPEGQPPLRGPVTPTGINTTFPLSDAVWYGLFLTTVFTV